MRLAIVGSRDYPHLDRVEHFVWAIPVEITIISGDAQGVDARAIKTARHYGHPTEEWPADWDLHGRSAGPRRNEAMIQTADNLIAFWDCTSRGTRHALQMALRYKVPFRVCGPDAEEIPTDAVTRALETA